MKLKKIDIGIKGLRISLKDFAHVWRDLEAGKRVGIQKGLYFDSIDTMRGVLTNNRLLILRTIREEKPKSVYELAKILGRDLKNVNQDLRMLSDLGLVTLETSSERKRRVIPHVDYRKIILEIPV